jgi:hypothetical protein
MIASEQMKCKTRVGSVPLSKRCATNVGTDLHKVRFGLNAHTFIKERHCSSDYYEQVSNSIIFAS